MKPLYTKDAPTPVGPYSQAIEHRGILFLSGQVPLDPVSQQLVQGSIEAQTERVLTNLRAVLVAAGSDFDRLLRVGVYLTDIAEFPRFNAVYERMLQGARPARSTVQVAALPLGAEIEIDAIAALSSD